MDHQVTCALIKDVDFTGDIATKETPLTEQLSQSCDE